MAKQLVLTALVLGCLFPAVAMAGLAVRLQITNDVCAVSICPGPNPLPPTAIQSGSPLTVYVGALDATNGRVTNLSTTVAFSSSDRLASLPSTFTFTPPDQGVRGFPNGVVLRSLGTQTITVMDSSGALLPGTLTMTVTGPLAINTPILSDGVKLLLAASLGLAGFLVLRSRL
jgi:hypothetical protein